MYLPRVAAPLVSPVATRSLTVAVFRCWPHVRLEQKDTEFSGQCGKQVEDYIECLHHRKEVRLSSCCVVLISLADSLSVDSPFCSSS
jgi:hypothetical protein